MRVLADMSERRGVGGRRRVEASQGVGGFVGGEERLLRWRKFASPLQIGRKSGSVGSRGKEG